MPNGTNENDKFKLHRFEKNNYFYGKLMTVRDFEAEQSYIDEKRHLINRLLHGSGLVCGFKEIQLKIKDSKVTIDFIDGGMALDCCGREIAVPANTWGKDIINSSGSTVSALPDGSFLYLKYKPCYEGYVAAASNPSSCEERCCPGRLVEDFEVVTSSVAPDSMGIGCRVDFPDKPDAIANVIRTWLDALEKAHISCPLCGENQGNMVFLGVVGAIAGGLTVNREDTEKYRIFFTQKELYQLLKCHTLDFKNPHGVTASQTGALESINEVKGNPNGNIDLIAGANISITQPADFTIEIASTGGAIPAATVKSVGTSLIVGTLDKYSRGDHVHDLGKEVVDFGNLSGTLQNQLNLLFMYLRERALKCTVSNFKAIWNQFQNELALNIVKVTKIAVDDKAYENEANFLSFMKNLLESMREFADSIRGNVTDESFENFMNSLEKLKSELDLDDALRVIRVAIQQDEVCFYTSELELRG